MRKNYFLYFIFCIEFYSTPEIIRKKCTNNVICDKYELPKYIKSTKCNFILELKL